MRQLAAMHVRSVLLTSGTLSPLDSFAHELQLPFRISLENPHVVDPSQVCCALLRIMPLAAADWSAAAANFLFCSCWHQPGSSYSITNAKEGTHQGECLLQYTSKHLPGNFLCV